MSSMLNPVPGEEIRVIQAIEAAKARGANCDDCAEQHTYEPGMCLAAVAMNAEDDARAETIEAESQDGHRLIIRSDEAKGRRRVIKFDCPLIICDVQGVLDHVGKPGVVDEMFALMNRAHAEEAAL